MFIITSVSTEILLALRPQCKVVIRATGEGCNSCCYAVHPSLLPTQRTVPTYRSLQVAHHVVVQILAAGENMNVKHHPIRCRVTYPIV
mgnify:CR=1 FL=1